MGKKKKKEKTVFIDDGSTIVDFSSFNKGLSRRESLYSSKGRNKSQRFKECFRTYIEAVKMMLVPMFITIGVITLAFLLVYLIL